jgi:hypothetical protein
MQRVVGKERPASFIQWKSPKRDMLSGCVCLAAGSEPSVGFVLVSLRHSLFRHCSSVPAQPVSCCVHATLRAMLKQICSSLSRLLTKLMWAGMRLCLD